MCEQARRRDCSSGVHDFPSYDASMNPWQWECFAQIMDGRFVTLTEPGPLMQPVRSFSIRRDEKRNLVLETVAVGQLKMVREEHPRGTVHTLTEVVRFKGRGGIRGTAKGVHPGDRMETRNADGVMECRETSHVSALDVSVRPGAAHCIIDWMENVNRGPLIWLGEPIRDHSPPGDMRTIGTGTTAIRFTGGIERDSSHHAALELTIGGVTLFLCESPDVQGRASPGFILYHGAPDEETRRRVRNVVSFAMGVGFVYLGSTALDENSNLLSTHAVSGNPFGDRLFEFAADPPAPLGTRGQNIGEQAALSRVAAALYDHYDEMNFDALSWAYWHAVCAPMHMKPAHFGSAIEGLQEAYCRARPDKSRTRLIQDKTLAKELSKRLAAALSGLELGEELTASLEGKISNLNRVSGAVLSERILAELGLAVGPADKAAWARRNDAAHGKPRRQDDTIPIMRDTKLLRLLLNRMVLKIASASPTYIDDYTVGHSIRALAHPVPMGDL